MQIQNKIEDVFLRVFNRENKGEEPPKITDNLVLLETGLDSLGFAILVVYGASKAGLEGFMRSLSREVGRAGITVNCVVPGFMLTDMTVGLEGSKLHSIKRRAPLGLPEPQNAAHTVRYLLEPGAVKTTGTVITVDGGSTA